MYIPDILYLDCFNANMPKSMRKNTKKAPARRRRAPARKPTFDKRVKAVISRLAENKVSNFRAATNLVPYTNVNWNTSVIPMTPDTLFLSIVQGTGQGARIGNSIRLKSLKFSGVIRPLPYNATSNPLPVPLYIKLYFLTRKDNPSGITGTLGDLLQYGNSSESPGNSAAIFNLNRMVNTDEWMLHTTRTYKLGYANYGGTGGSLDSQLHANNDFKLNHFVNVDLTKYCVKTIKFDDNTTDATTRNIVMYPVVYTHDGSVLPDLSSIPARLEYSLDMTYEDM